MAWTSAGVAGGRGSLELSVTAALVHGGSPAMEQWRKERVGSPSRASPGRGRRCGDRATVAKKWGRWRSVWAVHRCGKTRKRAGGGAVEDDGALPFCRVQGGGNYGRLNGGRPLGLHGAGEVGVGVASMAWWHERKKWCSADTVREEEG
jgi:hypothetical protein